MYIKTTVLALMDHGLAPPAAATHGCWTTEAMQLVPATVTEAIRVFAARLRVKPSMQAAIATVMAHGNNIRPASIGVKTTAGTVARQIMITHLTA